MSVSRFSAKFQDSYQDAKGRHSALRKLTVLLGMVAAFAPCAELESRAFVVASERALSSVSQAWGRCAVPCSSSTAVSGA